MCVCGAHMCVEEACVYLSSRTAGMSGTHTQTHTHAHTHAHTPPGNVRVRQDALKSVVVSDQHNSRTLANLSHGFRHLKHRCVGWQHHGLCVCVCILRMVSATCNTRVSAGSTTACVCVCICGVCVRVRVCWCVQTQVAGRRTYPRGVCVRVCACAHDCVVCL